MAAQSKGLDRLEAAAHRGLDLVSLWREVTPILAAEVPHFEAPCFFTVDPASLLTTSHFQEGLPEIPAEWLAREYVAADFNSMTEVLRSHSGVGTLHDATGGHPERASKYDAEMRPYGCEQELVFALRTGDGAPWGAVGLYRETGRAMFSDADKAFAGAAGRILADGVRFALLLGQGSDPDLPQPPGVIVLDTRLGVESATAAAVGWLSLLGGDTEQLPTVVLTVAGKALGDGRDAFARTRSVNGDWVLVQGSRLVPSGQVVLVMGHAPPAQLAPLLMRAYGLTAREQEVVGELLTGATTSVVARRLAIAEDTVQQHLSSIFTKTGVRSRGELVGRLFHAHYEPRVRDNEHRTQVGRPLRDGPMPVVGGSA